MESAEKPPPATNMPKTPVSLLQELYVRKGMTPKYDLVQIEGAVHEPTFKYRVSVGEMVATGCGQSKKKAKHTAAKAMLDKLKAAQKHQQSPAGQLALENDKNSTAIVPKISASKVVDLPKNFEAELISPYDDGISGNPIGDLQEMCMNRRIAPPVYEVGMEKGAPHERSFIIVCTAGGTLKESGSGKSKKLAKRQAAHKMIQSLKSMPVERDSDPLFALIDEDDLAQGIAKKTSSQRSGEPSGLLMKFHRDLKTSRGPHLAGLQNTDELLSDPVELLDKVAAEQDFELTLVDIEEKSKNDEFQCFMQMSTNPVAVCFGVGKTADLAKADAAANSLDYLKIMTAA